MKIGIGGNGLPRDLVEGDVLRRQIRRAGDDDAVAQALRITDGPAQRLHGAETAAHDRGELRDAEVIGQPRLRVHPVLDGDHRKVAAPDSAGVGIDAERPGGAVAAADIVDADDKVTIGVQRLAGADHVVPPAGVGRVIGMEPGDMVRGIERVADQHGVGAVGVECAVGLEHQFVVVQHRAAAQRQRGGKARGLRRDCADGPRFWCDCGCGHKKTPKACAPGLREFTHLFSRIYYAPAS